MPITVSTEALPDFVLRVTDCDSGASLGTGFVVAPGVALTCAHVVGGRESVRLETAAGAEVESAATVSKRSAHRDVHANSAFWPYPDLAVVSFESDLTLPIAWLDGSGLREGHDCWTWGFSRREQGIRSPGSPADFIFNGREGDGLLSLTCGQSNPGVSGAPLVSAATMTVVGLMSYTRQPDTARGGWATPISAVARFAPEVIEANRASRREPIDAWRRVFHVPGADLLQRDAAAGFQRGRRTKPSELLLAGNRVVPLMFRDAELAEIAEWCRSPEVLATMIVPAVGGAGKSRLALEAGIAMQSDGWLVGEVPEEAKDPSGFVESFASVLRPRLLVVDYVESRVPSAVADWIDRLSRSASELSPVRVLMLSRDAGSQAADDRLGAIKEASKVSLSQRAIDNTGEVDTVSNRLGSDQRAALYSSAVERFADAWEIDAPTGDAPELADTDFGTPLGALSAALLSVLGPADSDGRSPLTRLLTHEAKYWLPPEGVDDGLAARFVAVMTLCEASSAARLDAVLAALPELADDNALRDRIERWLSELYPGPGPAFANALRPDRLGEALVAREFLLDERGRTTLPAILRAAGDSQLTRAATVLTRCAGTSGELVAEVVLGELLGDLTARAVKGDDDLATAIAELAVRVVEPALEIEPLDGEALTVLNRALGDLADRLGEGRLLAVTIRLREGSVRVCERILGPTHPDTKAARQALAAARRALARRTADVRAVLDQRKSADDADAG